MGQKFFIGTSNGLVRSYVKEADASAGRKPFHIGRRCTFFHGKKGQGGLCIAAFQNVAERHHNSGLKISREFFLKRKSKAFFRGNADFTQRVRFLYFLEENILG